VPEEDRIPLIPAVGSAASIIPGLPGLSVASAQPVSKL
jgi:hypothetical protein